MPLVQLGCQGSLELTSPGTVNDLAMASDMASVVQPGTISFASIEADMEKPTFSCTNGTSGCHGGTMPTGVMQLAPMASMDMVALMNNYQQVLARVTVAQPDQSKLLLKTLQTSTTSHAGIKPFANAQDPTYQRWLLWIQLGANYAAVSTSGDM